MGPFAIIKIRSTGVLDCWNIDTRGDVFFNTPIRQQPNIPLLQNGDTLCFRANLILRFGDYGSVRNNKAGRIPAGKGRPLCS